MGIQNEEQRVEEKVYGLHMGDGMGLGEKVRRGLPRSLLFYKY